ncbi:3831_t:CDS:2, partial [Dentiscutata heterogama]
VVSGRHSRMNSGRRGICGYWNSGHRRINSGRCGICVVENKNADRLAKKGATISMHEKKKLSP